jgi:hypothetical protein
MADDTTYTVVSDVDRVGSSNSTGFFERNAALPNSVGASMDNTTYSVKDTVNGNTEGNGTGSFYEKNLTIETLVFSDDIVQEAAAQVAIATTEAGVATTQAGIAAAQAGTATTQAAAAAASASAAAASLAAMTAAAGTASPLMDGTATVGTSPKWSHEDHIHPTDTTRALSPLLPSPARPRHLRPQ